MNKRLYLLLALIFIVVTFLLLHNTTPPVTDIYCSNTVTVDGENISICTYDVLDMQAQYAHTALPTNAIPYYTVQTVEAEFGTGVWDVYATYFVDVTPTNTLAPSLYPYAVVCTTETWTAECQGNILPPDENP